MKPTRRKRKIATAKRLVQERAHDLTLRDVSRDLAHIADLTDRNQHIESLLVLAKNILRDDVLAEKLETLSRLYRKAGYLTPALKASKDRLYESAMQQSRRRMAPSVYREVHRRF